MYLTGSDRRTESVGSSCTLAPQTSVASIGEELRSITISEIYPQAGSRWRRMTTITGRWLKMSREPKFGDVYSHGRHELVMYIGKDVNPDGFGGTTDWRYILFLKGRSTDRHDSLDRDALGRTWKRL